MSGDGEWRRGVPFDVVGLPIEPSAIPHVQYNVGGLHGDAAKLKTIANDVHAAGGKINSRWRGRLPDHYHAPEVAELTADMARVVTKADRARTNLLAVGAALDTLASAVGPLQQKLEWLRSQAMAFNAWASSPQRLTDDKGLGWKGEVYPPWGKHGYEVNASLCNQVTDALNGIKNAERACNTVILGHTDAQALPPPSEIPRVRPVGNGAMRADDAANAAANDWRGMLDSLQGNDPPWWALPPLPAATHSNNPLSRLFGGALQGAFGALTDPVKFFGGLAGVGFAVATDPMHRGQPRIRFSWKTAKQTWLGVARMSMAGNPLTYAVPDAARDNLATLRALGMNFLATDEHDHWVQAGKIGVNVGALFAPSPVKGVGLGHALESLAAKGSRIAEDGGVVAKAFGAGLKLPNAVSDGAWLGGDVRLGLKVAAPHVAEFARTHADSLPLVRHLVQTADSDAARQVVHRFNNMNEFHDMNESLAAKPTHDQHLAGSRMRAWHDAAVDEETARYRDERIALSDEHRRAVTQAANQSLRSVTHSAADDLGRIEHRYKHDLEALESEHRQRMASIAHEADLRGDLAIRGVGKGIPDHDAAQLADILRRTDPSHGTDAVREYLEGLTSEERTDLARAHPDLMGALDHMMAEPKPSHGASAAPPVAGVASPSTNDGMSAFEAVWDGVREPLRERTLDIVLWRQGPLNTAGMLPDGYLWGDSEQEHEQLNVVFRYLQQHPDVAVVEYLKRHPLAG